MGIKKNIQKLLSDPKDMRLEQVINIMRHFGYGLDRRKGSHYTFSRKDGKSMTFPSHNKKVKSYYLRQLKSDLAPYLLMEP